MNPYLTIGNDFCSACELKDCDIVFRKDLHIGELQSEVRSQNKRSHKKRLD